jgi:hypothetical protein
MSEHLRQAALNSARPSHEAVELRLWADNDGPSYHRRTVYVLRNIAKRIGRPDYDHDRAVAFLTDGLVDAAKTYEHDHMTPGEWKQVFPPAVRREAAEMMVTSLEDEVALGNMP